MLAESFERIHRSNLVMMGVVPLEYRPDETATTHGLDGTETFYLPLDDQLRPRQEMAMTVQRTSGESFEIPIRIRVDTPIEVEYLRHGGILHYVLRQMAV
ncbi:hypothetical protein BH18ACT5_BH18ACT5_06450 [soil metagenome]